MPDPRDSELFGVFSEQKSLAGGANYTVGKDGAVPDRWKGKQLTVPNGGAVTGKGKDAMLDKALNLTVAGDTYCDPGALANMLTRNDAGHAIPFKPSNPAPRMGKTAGSLYGTFGPPNTLLDTDASLGQNSGRPTYNPADKKRNIYVNVPRKGGPGFPDQSRLLGETKYVYYPDTYCYARELEKKIREEARQKLTRPFLGSARLSNTFTSDAELYATPPNPNGGGAGRSSRSDTNGRPQWKPSNPPTKGSGHGTISKIPYVASPEREAEFHGKGAERPKPFFPVGGNHKRLSMWAPNPYRYAARPPPDNDMSLLG